MPDRCVYGERRDRRRWLWFFKKAHGWISSDVARRRAVCWRTQHGPLAVGLLAVRGSCQPHPVSSPGSYQSEREPSS